MENIARPKLNLLTDSQIAAVHEASLVILEKSGLRVDSERARLIYAEGGARIADDRVYIHRELVDSAIETAPSTIDVYHRSGEKAFQLGEGTTRFGVGVTNLWYQDPLTDELSPFARAGSWQPPQ